MSLKADIALVHGCGFDIGADGTAVPSIEAIGQAKKAVQILEDGVVGKLLFSGRGPNFSDEYPVTEAQTLRDIALSEGVDGQLLLTEDASTTTLANWACSVPIMVEQGVERVLGVSRKSQVKRAKMIGDFVTDRTDIDLVGYELSKAPFRPLSPFREAYQRRITERFIEKYSDANLEDLPALYEEFKGSAINGIKRLKYSAGSNRSLQDSE